MIIPWLLNLWKVGDKATETLGVVVQNAKMLSSIPNMLTCTNPLQSWYKIVITDDGEADEHVYCNDDVSNDAAMRPLLGRQEIVRKLFDCRRAAVGHRSQ